MLFFLAVLVSCAAAQALDGDPSCPCINASALLSQGGARACALPPLIDDEAPHFEPPLCYPVTYGSLQCVAHDAGLDPFCGGAAPPDFCSQAWCWVDVDACQQGKMSVRRSAYYSTENLRLYYSYATCGSTIGESSWLSRVVDPVGKINHVRIAVPGLYYPGHYKLSAANSSAEIVAYNYHDDAKAYFLDDSLGVYAGVLVDLMKAILALPGCNISSVTYHHRSNHSYWEPVAQGSSGFAVALDVSKGIADIGVGARATLERLEFTGFTIPLYMDKFYMWSGMPSSSNWSASFVFAPIRWDSWVALLSSMLIVAILQTLLEYSPKSGDEDGMATAHGMVRSLPLNAYGVVTDFLAGVNADRFFRPASKLLGMSWGFFCIIFVSMYTAELAAVLINQQPSGWWESLQSAATYNKKVCVQMSLATEVRQVWPEVDFVVINGLRETVVGFAEGRCDAILLVHSDVNGIRWLGELICDPRHWYTEGLGARELSWAMNPSGRKPPPKGPLVRSKLPEVEMPVALATRPNLAAPMSLWIKQLERFNKITYQSLRRNYMVPSKCYPKTGPLAGGSKSDTYEPNEAFAATRGSIGVGEMFGVLLVLIVAVGVASVAKVVEIVRSRRRAVDSAVETV